MDLKEVCRNDQNREKLCDYLLGTGRCSSSTRSPFVLKELIANWAASRWTPEILTEVFGDKLLTFRIGLLNCNRIQWETDCQYVHATVGQFYRWVNGEDCSSDDALKGLDPTTHWCYADYKHFAELFPLGDTIGEERDKIMRAIDWSTLGLSGRNGEQSTFWLGTQGAYTVCHYDSYGCNVVAQLYGRKRWVLHPPSQSDCLYPTRIPYEESSIFSQVNIKDPDFTKHSKFQEATPIVVILEPGDVLFVPRHWWHYVETLDKVSISINTWLEQTDTGIDCLDRIKEAITRTMAFMIISQEPPLEVDRYLNPTESITDHSQNLSYLHSAITACKSLQNDRITRNDCVNGNIASAKQPSKRSNTLTDEISAVPAKKLLIQSSSENIGYDDEQVSMRDHELQQICNSQPAGYQLSYDSKAVVNIECNNASGNTNAIAADGAGDFIVSREFDARHVKRLFPEAVSDVYTNNHVRACTADLNDVSSSTSNYDESKMKNMIDCFTSMDLADILLHPDVINVIYDKLAINFKLK